MDVIDRVPKLELKPTSKFIEPLRGRVMNDRDDPFRANFVKEENGMDTALDPLGDSIARRCGVIRTSRVNRRTTLLLVRFRFHIISRRGDVETPLLAEDCQTLAFAGAPLSAEWLDTETAETLLAAEPDANITPEQQIDFIRKVIDGFDALRPHLNQVAEERGAELLEAHRRVRIAAQAKGVSHRVEAQLPPDALGIYVYLPKGG